MRHGIRERPACCLCSTSRSREREGYKVKRWAGVMQLEIQSVMVFFLSLPVFHLPLDPGTVKKSRKRERRFMSLVWLGRGGRPWHGKGTNSLHSEFCSFPPQSHLTVRGKQRNGQAGQRSKRSLVKLAEHYRASRCLPYPLRSCPISQTLTPQISGCLCSQPCLVEPERATFLHFSLTNGLWRVLASPPTLQISACFRHPILLQRQSAGILGPRVLFPCQFPLFLSLPEAWRSCIMQRF